MRRWLALLVVTLTLGCALLSPTPVFADANNGKSRVVRLGVIWPTSGSSTFDLRNVPAFWSRLRELGWLKGQNLIVEERWAAGMIDRLPALFAELVSLKVDVIITFGTPAAIAAKKATKTIPIVNLVLGDPVGAGVAASLAHPGGNLTGLSLGWDEDIAGKWLELLQELVPRLSTVAIIMNPTHQMTKVQAKRLEAIAPRRGLKTHIIEVSEPQALDGAFEQAARTAQAVLVLADPNLITQQQRVVALAAKYKLPDMHTQRDFVEIGGMMSYAGDYLDMFRRGAEYVDKILRGANPGNLPIQEPTKLDLVVNLKTAKALGIKIPESIMLRATEAIR